MPFKRITTTILVLVAMALSATAQASSFEDLASLGYSTHRVTGVTACYAYNGLGASDSASGFGVSVDFGCVNGPGYDAAIDAFAAGHAERKLAYEHPDAVAARSDITGKGYAVSVDYTTATFTVTGDCNVNATVTADNLPAFDASLAASAPCPAPPVTTETTTTAATETTTATTAPDPSVSVLQAQVDALVVQVASLQTAIVAAWDEYTRLVNLGASASVAALGARSAALNTLYGLGD